MGRPGPGIWDQGHGRLHRPLAAPGRARLLPQKLLGLQAEAVHMASICWLDLKVGDYSLHRQCVQECESPDQISRHDQSLPFRGRSADCHRLGFLSALRRRDDHLMESVWIGGMQYTLLIFTVFLD